MKYLTMTGFTVRTASDRWTLGYEGENNSRTLQIKTTDDLTDFATVNLLINTLDCGAMTVETVSNYKVLSMVLTAGMLGEAGKKTCQLLMMDSEGTVIKKTNQFLMVVNTSNTVDGMAPDSPTAIIITDYIDDAINERVSDEFLEGKINDWLEAHPEATTTVQDGSISVSKLDQELLKSYKENGSVRFYFPNLSSGGYSGNCSLVVTPTKTILMDCGTDIDWLAIKEYFDDLYNNGIFTNIDIIVISHFHYDHVDCLDDILDTYPHTNCHAYIPLNPSGYNAGTSGVLQKRTFVIDTLTQYEIEYTEVNTERSVVVDNDFVTMNFFNSTPTDYAYYSGISAVYNNYSMVTLFGIGNVYAMFPGDIQREAQIHIMNTRELPRLFLYCVHHHGIQNDDYMKYLDAISPEYSIIMTSHNRALESAASSFAGNYLYGNVGSTGFSAYEYVCGKDGGSIVSGLVIPKIGWYYTYVDLYVDNSYTGSVHDGTQEHPFTQINEAIMFINQASNLYYRIKVVGTGTRYEFVWLRNIHVAVEIIGVSGAGGYPTVKGIYARNCGNIAISYLTIDGQGREANDRPTLVYVWATPSFFMTRCTIDGSSLSSSATKWGIQVRHATLYVSNSTIQNIGVGIGAYLDASVVSSANTFSNITSSCYLLADLSLTIRGSDTVSNAANWMMGHTTIGRPFVCSYKNLTAALLALNTSSVVSEPFYANSNNPVCVCQGSKVFNILTGAEVSLT